MKSVQSEDFFRVVITPPSLHYKIASNHKITFAWYQPCAASRRHPAGGARKAGPPSPCYTTGMYEVSRSLLHNLISKEIIAR